MRNLKDLILGICLLVISLGFSQQPHSGGIVVPTGFKITANQPVDDRTVVQSPSDLDSLPNKYAGLICYVEDNESVYYYNGEEWFKVNGGSYFKEITKDGDFTAAKIEVGADTGKFEFKIVGDETLEWLIGNDEYVYNLDSNDEWKFIADALGSGVDRRIDAVSYGNDGEVHYWKGTETGQASYPNVPENHILRTFVTLTETGIEETNPSEAYIPKTSQGWVSYVLNSSVLESVPTLNAQHNIAFQAFTNGHIIPGLNITTTAAKIWHGGMIAIRNNSPFPITLKHLGSAGKIRFDFSNTKEDFVLTNDNGVKYFKLGVIPTTGNATAYCLNDFDTGASLTLEQARQNGNVLEGDVEFEGSLKATSGYDTWILDYVDPIGDNDHIGIYVDDGNFYFRAVNSEYEQSFGFGGTMDMFAINGNNPNFKGILGYSEFNKQGDRKAFAQISDLEDALEDYIQEPTTDGTSGQVLTTDGSGGRSWTTVSGASTPTLSEVLAEGNVVDQELQFYASADDEIKYFISSSDEFTIRPTNGSGVIGLEKDAVTIAAGGSLITASENQVLLNGNTNTYPEHKGLTSAFYYGGNATNNCFIQKKYVDDNFVSLTGNQTVTGVKTFTSSPIVPTATTPTQAINKGQMDTALNAYVNAGTNNTTGGSFSLDKLVLRNSTTDRTTTVTKPNTDAADSNITIPGFGGGTKVMPISVNGVSAGPSGDISLTLDIDKFIGVALGGSSTSVNVNFASANPDITGYEEIEIGIQFLEEPTSVTDFYLAFNSNSNPVYNSQVLDATTGTATSFTEQNGFRFKYNSENGFYTFKVKNYNQTGAPRIITGHGVEFGDETSDPKTWTFGGGFHNDSNITTLQIKTVDGTTNVPYMRVTVKRIF